MAISNGYLTEAELNSYISISDTADTAEVELAIEAASRTIDTYCERVFYDTGSATARTYVATNPYRLPVGDFSTVDGLVVKTDTTDDGTFDTTWDAADYQVEPLNPVDGHPFEQLVAVKARCFPTYGRRARVQVTARWGWAAVPAQVKHACAIQAGTLFKRATEGAAPVVTVDGTTLHSSKFIDHQAALLLDPLRRHAVAVA